MTASDEDPLIFDRRVVRLHRDRAARSQELVAGIADDLGARLLDRLDDVQRSFTTALDIGGRGAVASALRARGTEVVSCDLSLPMARQAGGLPVCADEEFLPFGPGSFDLIVACASLHWVNDLPGTLAQIRYALKPDGLFLACIPVLPTLSPLRHALVSAEDTLRGGASARVSPFPTLRDCAGLMQRAGFALPVADQETLTLQYRTAHGLLKDLRAAGETSALRQRERSIPSRALFPLTLARLEENGPPEIQLHMAMISGWAPAASQPQPLKPGAFTTSLSDILDSLPEPEDRPS
ncbi:methyltransferase domain-containing protein [Acetobacter sp. AN02]|uniref:methyltransferase domain-containing protein n=1 Tax=Acetobacter sp. AN02 TaxID=2894186 RepID=UPI002434618A|nr:methyltransferase domain-containing protein [Acetobacter sp. AN02]MDG6094973.1 methyltransferase domain-containing protein [Acetobacter sp. AN02]